LTREKVIKASLSSPDCNTESEHSSSLTDTWAKFDELLASSPPGNGGNIGVHLLLMNMSLVELSKLGSLRVGYFLKYGTFLMNSF